MFASSQLAWSLRCGNFRTFPRIIPMSKLNSQTTPFSSRAVGQIRAAIIAVSISSSLAYANNQAPVIPGVIKEGTKIEFIKEGFEGTEGPITAPDGSLLFTETRANRITRIAPDNSISTFLENTNGANGLAFNKAGELLAVQVVDTQVGVIYP